VSVAHASSPEGLPAWSLPLDAVERIRLSLDWPTPVSRDWAFGNSTGAGARVCVLDSGVEPDHPLVGKLNGSFVVSLDEDGGALVATDEVGDVSGHGTACAGVIRELAPDCELVSARVLGEGFRGSGAVLLAGLRWAIGEGFDVVNLSLSTTKQEFAALLHELADEAYFKRTLIVSSAHNMPVPSFPWRFASVLSVGSHEENDPYVYYYNPTPPVEFFARGLNVEVPWLGGGSVRCTGNSFATPHISGIAALIRSKHRDLTPFQVKSVLALTANNVGAPA
jgi:subtilisin family serine protease